MLRDAVTRPTGAREPHHRTVAGGPPVPAPRAAWPEVAVVVGLLTAFLALAYPHVIGLPFVNDDYFILDRVLGLDFPGLWRPVDPVYHWYRPWSRELHYWVLDRAFDSGERVAHAASLGLWLVVIALYFVVARALASRGAALVATACVAALALWGVPLLWVAGAQDLWMLVFALLFLWCVARGRPLLAAPGLVLALLSKETAAVLPLLALAYEMLIRRRSPAAAAAAAAPYVAITVAWALLHPTLAGRLSGAIRVASETVARLPPHVAAARTLLAQFNLDAVPRPATGWGTALALGLAAAAPLAVLVLAARAGGMGRLPGAGSAGAPDRAVPPARADAHPPGGQVIAGSSPAARPPRLIAFAACWALLGWLPLLSPSIGWHSYYGVLGTLGFWLAIASLVRARTALALTLIVGLSVLRAAQAHTPSWDWATEWYQRRAGAFLAAIRGRMLELHPALPRHGRLWFTRVPNNIGLLDGDGPAFRVWYRDSTLRAGFFSRYAPRRPPAAPGPDLFFRFDSVQVLVPIVEGPEHVAVGAADTAWIDDHAQLAMLLLRGGELPRAAAEFDKLYAAEPARAEFAVYAGAVYEALGDRARAERRYHAAGAGGVGRDAVQSVAREVLAGIAARDSAARAAPP